MLSWDTDSGKGNRTQHEKYNSFQHGKVCISPEIWTFFLALLLLEGTDPISYDIKEIRCKKAYRERGKSGMVRFKYDNDYVNDISLKKDISICAMTFLKIIKQSDVVVAGSNDILDLDEERSS